MPSASDPLGENDPPGFEQYLMGLIDRQVEKAWRGRAKVKWDGVPDAELAMELMARGWAVFRPIPPKDRY